MISYFLRPKEEKVLDVAVLDESLRQEETVVLKEELEQLFSVEE